MGYTVLPLQRVGAHFLAGRRGRLLGDEMGVGKTVQAILAAKLVDAKRVRVIAPASVCPLGKNNDGHWHKQWRLWWPEFKGQLVVSSFEKAIRGKPEQADVLIVDEFHYLKNAMTKRSLSIFGTNGYAHNARFIWGLSGTPAPNGHAIELWPWLYFFGATKLGYYDFLRRYCEYREVDERGYSRIQIFGNKNVEELKGIIRPILLRRTLEQAMAELPQISLQYLNLQPKAVDIETLKAAFPAQFSGSDENAAVSRFMRALDVQETALDAAMESVRIEAAHNMGTSNTANVTRILQSLQEASSSYRLYSGLLKREALPLWIDAKLKSLTRKKLVVFCYHRLVIALLEAALKRLGWKTSVVQGGTTPQNRGLAVEKFQDLSEAGTNVFIGQITAAGTGLDGLQHVCNDVLFAESAWVPGVNAQAIARVRRLGQQNRVNVYVACVPGSLDEAIVKTTVRKTVNINELLS